MSGTSEASVDAPRSGGTIPSVMAADVAAPPSSSSQLLPGHSVGFGFGELSPGRDGSGLPRVGSGRGVKMTSPQIDSQPGWPGSGAIRSR
jgi:hypothetical protein